MSLFGKKGGEDSEAARQLAIKQALNKELSTGIKKLQRDHISSDSAIRSGDTANRICNVLEAIFLHELKDSYASKSFWPFVSKFTHKDVVAQIKALSLINAEVGCCRAWIRMGLNDCLMDSYVDAMLSDAKTIRTFYKKSSFLRDPEQPHIMKNYLQGLGNFAFQLSYNSSVLNIWGAAPMIASGSWAPPRDSPVTVSEPSTPRLVGLTGLVHQYSDPTSTYTSPKAKQVDSPLADPGPSVSHNIEGSFHESEISSNLLHSPSDEELAIPITVVPESKKHSPHREKKVKIQKVATQDEPKDTAEPYQQKEQSCQRPFNQQQDHPERTVDETGNESNFGESSKKKAKPDDCVAEDRIESHMTPFANDECDDIEHNLETKDSSTVMTTNQIPPNPFEEEATSGGGREFEQQEGVMNPFDQQPASTNPFDEPDEPTEAHTAEGSDVNPPAERTAEKPPGIIQTAGDDFYGSHFYGSPAKRKPVEVKEEPEDPDVPEFAITRRDSPAELSMVMAVEQKEEEQRRSEDSERHDDDDFDNFQGNSLGARSGWSSSFEHQANTPITPEASLPGETSRSALASYKSLLEDYAALGTSGPLPETNWDDLMGHSMDSEQQTSLPPKVKDKPSRLTSISAMSDTDISLEYEVIPFSSSPTSKYADTRTQSLLNIVTVIGREKGLDSQNYQCKGCSRPVGIIYGKANVCSYDGGYYCFECHTDDEAIIPAKILYSWDFRKHKVSKHTKIFLQQIEAMPLIDVGQCNPSLYKAIPELAEIMILRSQLKYLKAYLFTCQQSVAEELRKKVWPREYMLDHMHLYSTQDFLQIQGGNLMQFLKRVIVFAAKHVQQCALCSQKGFICEICNSDKVIYPFDVELTTRCEKCTTVFHKSCKTESIPCPKCERRRIRRGHPQFHGSQEEVDFASPFT